jgi:O-acetylhomoserine/O-acetylserine sulfhydrylase-like pyridoxal-dependent enzyme
VAAITAVGLILGAGDHVVYVQCTNGDADWLFRTKWQQFGIDVKYVYSNKVQDILPHLQPNTKVRLSYSRPRFVIRN